MDTTPVRLSGEPMACPFTAVMTDPAVMPAAAAGPQNPGVPINVPGALPRPARLRPQR